MKPHRTNSAPSSFLLPDHASQLDPREGLYRLARDIDRECFKDAFESLYSAEGRPALLVRRMVGLMMLNRLQNLSDERVVEFWSLSPYAQFFCGELEMQWRLPCEASELVHFRNRIGPDGSEKIFASTIRRRAAIEPRIGYLKSDFRLGRNFLKGQKGDAINLIFAATASNLSLWMRKVLSAFYCWQRFLPSNPASHLKLAAV